MGGLWDSRWRVEVVVVEVVVVVVEVVVVVVEVVVVVVVEVVVAGSGPVGGELKQKMILD